MVDTKEEVAEVKKKTDKFIVSEIATQTAPVIRDTEDAEKIYDSLTILCKIANDVEEIKKGIL